MLRIYVQIDCEISIDLVLLEHATERCCAEIFEVASLDVILVLRIELILQEESEVLQAEQPVVKESDRLLDHGELHRQAHKLRKIGGETILDN